MRPLLALFALFFLSAFSGSVHGRQRAGIDAKIPVSRKFIVLTDMLVDDRAALMILSRYLESPEAQLMLVGVSTMNSRLKKALGERLLAQLSPHWAADPSVFEGRTGLGPGDYPNVSANAPVYSFATEADDIIDKDEQSKLVGSNYGVVDNELTRELKKVLDYEKKENTKAEIIGIGSLTDLAVVLQEAPELVGAISRVHLAGGWAEAGDTQCSSFNYNYDPAATDYIFQLANAGKLDLLLYPSRVTKATFGGGSLRSDVKVMQTEAQELIAVMEQGLQEGSAPFVDFFHTNARFNAIWGPYESEPAQVSYSDMLPVIGIITEDFVTDKAARNVVFKCANAKAARAAQQLFEQPTPKKRKWERIHKQRAGESPKSVLADWSAYIRVDTKSGDAVGSLEQCGFALEVGPPDASNTNPSMGIHEVLGMDPQVFYTVATKAFKELIKLGKANKHFKSSVLDGA